jgi:superfamily II DNA or RNA helicase
MVEPFVPPPPLFDYQQELAASLQDFLANDHHELACLLQLPTGAGKTRVAMEAIVRHLNATKGEQRKIGLVWLAHSEELCDQAVESFLRVWVAQGTFEVKLVRFWGSYHAPMQELHGGFVVASYQRMTQFREKSPDDFALFVRSLDLLLIDEAHRALAPTIKQLIASLKSSNVKIVGLTATPGRGQDALLENRQLATLFEHRLLRANSLGMNPVEKLHQRGILARVRREIVRSGVETGQRSDNAEFTDDVPARVLTKLATDTRRNELLIDTVEAHIKLGHPTLVFCCTVKHAKSLAILAAARGVRSAFLDCEMARGRRSRIVASFRSGSIDALFNYGVLSTGFDAPRIRCVVIARPTSSIVLYSQMIGRGLRGPAVGGGDEFTLVDVQDNIENFGGIGEVYRHFEAYWG